MGGIVHAIFGGGSAPKVTIPSTPTAEQLAEQQAQKTANAEQASAEQAELNADRRRAASGTGTTLLTGTGITDPANVKAPGLVYKSTLGGM